MQIIIKFQYQPFAQYCSQLSVPVCFHEIEIRHQKERPLQSGLARYRKISKKYQSDDNLDIPMWRSRRTHPPQQLIEIILSISRAEEVPLNCAW